MGLGILADLHTTKGFMMGIPSAANLLLKYVASLDWDIAVDVLANSTVAERFSFWGTTAWSEVRESSRRGVCS